MASPLLPVFPFEVHIWCGPSPVTIRSAGGCPMAAFGRLRRTSTGIYLWQQCPVHWGNPIPENFAVGLELVSIYIYMCVFFVVVRSFNNLSPYETFRFKHANLNQSQSIALIYNTPKAKGGLLPCINLCSYLDPFNLFSPVGLPAFQVHLQRGSAPLLLTATPSGVWAFRSWQYKDSRPSQSQFWDTPTKLFYWSYKVLFFNHNGSNQW